MMKNDMYFFFGVGKEWKWKNRNFEVRSGERDGGKKEIWDLFEKKMMIAKFSGVGGGVDEGELGKRVVGDWWERWK